MIVAIDFRNLLVERPAHDVSHHHLDALRSRYPHVLGMPDARKRERIPGQAVEKGGIELPIDEPGTFPLQLVRHAARSIDDHAQILLIAVHGAADSLTELVASGTGRRRALHDVHTEWGHSQWPLCGL